MRRALIGFTSLFLTATAAVAQAPAELSGYGVWINPKRTAIMETKACGEALCGTIVWATSNAREAAKGQGIASLVGLQLLRNYRRTGAATWDGEVFVPSLGRRLASQLEQLGPNELKISGCVLGVVCKAQVWTRTAKPRGSG